MIQMTATNLKEVLGQSGEGNFEGYLDLPAGPWNLATEGIFIAEDINAGPHATFSPAILDACKIEPTLEAAGVEDVIAYARQQRTPAGTRLRFRAAVEIVRMLC